MIIPSNSHVALVASPGLGHLIPILELAKRLVSHHGLYITIFAITPHAHQAEHELLSSVSSSSQGLIEFVIFPTKKLHFPPDLGILSRLLAMSRTTFLALRSLIFDMKPEFIAMIVDMSSVEAVDVVRGECNMKMKYYVFIASNAMFLSYNLYLPYVDKGVNRDEPFYIPGCEPIMGEDLLELTFLPSGPGYLGFVRLGVEIATFDGILVNTWKDLEAKTILAFRDESCMKLIAKAPVYPIGPLIKMCKDEPMGLKSELIKWLDCQPNESVVYISFGSGGTLSCQQTIELAWGLELSKQRFIWVIRPPIENDGAAFLFKSIQHVSDGLDELQVSKYFNLPDGFLGRTKDMGLVIPMWAPQEDILSHPSTGAFVCHCGWNSTLESIVNEVPIIAWPLYAEQNMNASMLAKYIGVAIKSQMKQPSKNLLRRDEIAKMLTRVMVEKEGIDIRNKVQELKASANNALREGGSSYDALSKVVQNIVG
ncbi:unnamed protein product [Amaranthus hypochondriacus]